MFGMDHLLKNFEDGTWVKTLNFVHESCLNSQTANTKSKLWLMGAIFSKYFFKKLHIGKKLVAMLWFDRTRSIYYRKNVKLSCVFVRNIFARFVYLKAWYLLKPLYCYIEPTNIIMEVIQIYKLSTRTEKIGSNFLLLFVYHYCYLSSWLILRRHALITGWRALPRIAFGELGANNFTRYNVCVWLQFRRAC